MTQQRKDRPLKDFSQIGPAMGRQPEGQPPQQRGRPPAVPQQAARPQMQGGQGGGLPANYLRDGYFDARGSIRDEFIVNDAQILAERLEAGGMTRSLLRNFYNEVATLRQLVRARPDDFPRYRARVLKLRAHASNALNRRTGKAPELFYQFVDKNVTLAAEDHNSFLAGFCQHFECIVLYFKGR